MTTREQLFHTPKNQSERDHCVTMVKKKSVHAFAHRSLVVPGMFWLGNKVLGYLGGGSRKVTPYWISVVLLKIVSNLRSVMGDKSHGEGKDEAHDDEDRLEHLWRSLCEMFPQALPDFLLDKARQVYRNPDALQELANSFIDFRRYPTVSDQEKDWRQRKGQQMKRKYTEGTVTVEDFLEVADDPVEFFYDVSRTKNANYKSHTWIYLLNEFPRVNAEVVRETLNAFNYSLTKSFHELLLIYGAAVSGIKPAKRRNVGTVKLLTKPRANSELPVEPDELFYQEMAFLSMEDEVREYFCTRKCLRLQKLEDARAKGELVTCLCCYEDEFLMEETLLCNNCHIFCKGCLQRSSQEVIGQGELVFPCLVADCNSVFSLEILELVLKPIVFARLLLRIQEDEVRKANLPDLVSCPFCSYSAVVPNQDDKVFKCLNPECMKESCRFCRQLSHIPLHCNEVESNNEVKMRTFIENRMSEAVVRVCPQCKKNFVKEYGCNKMRCSCGFIMCYICRRPIHGYAHFGIGWGQCPLWGDKDRPNVAAQDAEREFLELHPEMKGTKLKHHPVKGHCSKGNNNKRK